jgi:hypothetical protein
MSNVLRELFVKISMMGSQQAIAQEKELGKAADKTTKDMKEQSREASNLSRQLSSMGSNIASISNVLKGLLIGKVLGMGFNLARSGVHELTGSIERSVDEASEAQQGLTNLATALSITGEYSQEAMEDMEGFAARMQQTTRASDDMVISLLAQAKAYNATNEQAKKIVETGIDFAAATDKTIPEAVEAVAVSLSGMTREIQRYVPEIKNLTDEQLAAGAAIDLMNKRFAGSAVKNINTYRGAADQLANSWGDVFENIGNPIAKSMVPIFKELTALIQKLLPDFTTFGEKIAQSFLIVRDAFFGTFDVGGGAQKVLGKIGQFLIDMALLVEDFFFFLRGEPSFLGKLTGAGNLAELIGAGLGMALTKLPGILWDLLKGAIPPILNAIKAFFFTILTDAIEATLVTFPTWLVNKVIGLIKKAVPLLDAMLGPLIGSESFGLEDATKDMKGTNAGSMLKGLNKISEPMKYLDPMYYIKGEQEYKDYATGGRAQSDIGYTAPDAFANMQNYASTLGGRAAPGGGRGQIMDLSGPSFEEMSAWASMNSWLQQMAESQKAQTGLFTATASRDARAQADLIQPGDQTLNRNDNRITNNNLDVRIQSNQPATAIQRQLNSLYFSQQTAGGN